MLPLPRNNIDSYVLTHISVQGFIIDREPLRVYTTTPTYHGASSKLLFQSFLHVSPLAVWRLGGTTCLLRYPHQLLNCFLRCKIHAIYHQKECRLNVILWSDTNSDLQGKTKISNELGDSAYNTDCLQFIFKK